MHADFDLGVPPPPVVVVVVVWALPGATDEPPFSDEHEPVHEIRPLLEIE